MKEIIKKRVLEIVNSNLEYEKITMEQCEDDLLEYGMDSIRFIQTIVSLEEEFECEVPDSKLLLVEMNTINKIYEVLISIDSNESNIVY
ncbi:MAG: acyl carrier protein [Clostridia bacterium]|nr:acyl carrier protein [Clostridia bacterium]